MKKTIIILHVLLFFASSIFSQEEDPFFESQVLERGGVKSFGYANANVGRTGESEFFTESPASPANLEVPVLCLNYGDILAYNNYINLSYSHPTIRGIVSANFKYFNAHTLNQALDNAININLNFSKIFTEKLFVGLGLKFLSAEYFNDSGIGFGLNMGAIYHVFDYNKNRKHKIVDNVKIGASLLNIGNYFENPNTDRIISPPFKLKVGPTFLFNISTNFQNSFSIDLEYRNLNDLDVNIGTENVLQKKYIFRLGYSIESEYQDFSFGLGYKFKIKEVIDSEANYSLVSLKNDEILHNLGIEMRFGQVDTTPPETKVGFNLSDISPNYDGKSDYLEITPEMSDDKLLKRWEIKVVDSKNNPVKQYESPDLDTLKGKLTFKKVLTKLWEKKREAPIPEKIIWDGIDEKGKDVPDGQYKVVLTAYDEKLNQSQPVVKNFNLDRTPPEITITPDHKIFSPNGDGIKDTIKFIFDIKTEKDDQWKGRIVDVQNKTVKEFTWRGKQIREITWDGKDDKGNMTKDGNYDLIVEGIDAARNSVKGIVYGFTLTTARQSVAVSSSLYQFSPNNDEVMDNTDFELFITDIKGLERWKLSILDEAGEEVKTFEGRITAPEIIQWDGKDKNDNILKDDDYLYKFEAWYDSGNHPESFPKKIRIDNTPPEVDFKISPEIFSPDSDDENDIASFEIGVKDKSEIKNWIIFINEVDINNNREIFKSYKQSGKPGDKIFWNGLSDSGKLVQSKNKYLINFEIEDQLGNKTVLKEKEIEISKEPPDVDFEFEPELFSPDDDEENDLLIITLYSYNNKKIKSWKLDIYPIRGGKRESLFMDFSGEKLTNRPIIWDGKNPEGELVESAMKYELQLTVEDILGNVRQITKDLDVDVLVIKTAYGLKIKISNIEFEYNKADLRGNAFRILDRVIEILKKYPEYKVRIEGYTDNKGPEEYNLKLSEKRAQSVYNYSVDNGVDKKLLTIKGLGFSRPTAPNNKPDGSDNPEGRAKNRRVEFLLIKPGMEITPEDLDNPEKIEEELKKFDEELEKEE